MPRFPPALAGVDAVGPAGVPSVAVRVVAGQLGALPVTRIVGLLVLVVVATGVLIVAFRTSHDRESVDGDDDDGGLYDPGPAYGAGGTRDVSEVLQVEREDEDDEEEFGVAMPDEGFDHDVVGPRNEGLLVEVTGEGGTGRFIVDDPEATVPDVVPASPRGQSDPEWTVDVVAYLREQEFDVPLDPSDAGDGVDDPEGRSDGMEDPDETSDVGDDPADPDRDDAGDSGPEFDHEVRGERTRGYLVEVTDGVATAEFFVRHVASADPTVEPASPRERRHGERWTRLAESYLRERAVADELAGDVEVERE